MRPLAARMNWAGPARTARIRRQRARLAERRANEGLKKVAGSDTTSSLANRSRLAPAVRTGVAVERRPPASEQRAAASSRSSAAAACSHLKAVSGLEAHQLTARGVPDLRRRTTARRLETCTGLRGDRRRRQSCRQNCRDDQRKPAATRSAAMSSGTPGPATITKMQHELAREQAPPDRGGCPPPAEPVPR